jgi:hypothetical protein
MILIDILIGASVVNAAASMYAIFRKPRTVVTHSIVHNTSIKDANHNECGVCHSVVARYTSKDDGSVVCKNCETF